MRPERVRGLSDEALMDRYARGDGAAFDELFARYQERAYAFFLWRVGSAEHAADLYQELFLRIHRARERYDPGRPFAPWFFQIARRLDTGRWLARRGGVFASAVGLGLGIGAPLGLLSAALALRASTRWSWTRPGP